MTLRTGTARPRFTPTRVGTTQTFNLQASEDTVHPHARGDDANGAPCQAAAFGSPPRAGGRRRDAANVAVLVRFTPTRVGTTPG